MAKWKHRAETECGDLDPSANEELWFSHTKRKANAKAVSFHWFLLYPVYLPHHAKAIRSPHCWQLGTDSILPRFRERNRFPFRSGVAKPLIIHAVPFLRLQFFCLGSFNEFPCHCERPKHWILRSRLVHFPLSQTPTTGLKHLPQGSHFSATTKFQDFSRNLMPFSRYIFALAANLQLQF